MQKIYYYYQKQLRSLSRTETVAQLEQKDVAKKNFWINCPNEDDAREGTKKTIQGGIGITTAIDAPAGGIAALVAKPVGKAAEGIGQATDCKEIKVVGQGTQDAVDEPLEKIGEGAKEIGEEFKKGFEDLGDKIDEVFK